MKNNTELNKLVYGYYRVIKLKKVNSRILE